MASSAARVHAPETTIGPAATAAAAALRAGDPRAADRLWARAVAAGGPLVEALPGDLRHRAVTFLWRDAEGPAPEVLLVLDTITDRHRDDLGPAILRPIGGRLRAITYRLESDLRASYGFHLAPAIDPGLGRTRPGWRAVRRGLVPDPLCADRMPTAAGGEVSVLSLPDAPPQPWRAADGVRRGRVERHLVPSAALGGARETWAYVPASAARGAPDPLAVAVLLDGDVWGAAIPIAPTLDALIAAGAIPPTCVLMPHSLDAATRERDMAMDDAHVRFLTDELLPWATARWPLTDDPAHTVVAGQSLGGLGAAYAGLTAPRRFGGVLAQSGSFWWPEDDDGTQHERIVAWVRGLDAPPAARFWMEVGRHEWMLLDGNRRMRDALVAAGADVAFREYGGGHDYACWRGGLADGLVALLG
ncbi:enterochelin esterase [Patulibacter sp. SYSU D01012]|uniref:enterochelin esterase n=1 Tax=Patulibacter sp. SYSU D01012 TaxID=2817381 RepID=UPI001B3156B6|nr:enterochelin esterase [Patulibacter sp. SYSU D01012]